MATCVDQCVRGQQKGNLIELDWVGRDTVAEVHALRQRGSHAVSVIVQPHQETADPTDADVESQWQHERRTGRVVDPGDFFSQLHANQTAQQRADDRLAFQQGTPIGKIGERVRGSSSKNDSLAFSAAPTMASTATPTTWSSC